ncbi:MAG: Ig-like domain-containing protein [Treponema sp.]|jgi:hypothetical protein|nr:Ig-like domain-containing protein [Treponema sp.]
MQNAFIKKILLSGAALLLTLMLPGCPGILDSGDPEISSVTISPADASVVKGETLQFSAAVEGTGEYSPAVVWTVEGKTGAHTAISAAGLLAVAADETAEILTVTATAAADAAKYGRVTVNITQAAESPAGPSILSVTISPANAAVTKGETLQFSAAVEGTGEYSDAVVWTVEGKTGAQTTISGSGLLTVAADETAETLTVTAASAADAAKYGRVTVNIVQTAEPPAGPSILSVTISPANAAVMKGETFQFSAAVEGTGEYSPAVVWTVEGKTGAHTAISAAGLLAVAADETAETLTVTAASAADAAKYGRVTVNITQAEEPPAGPSILSVTISPANAAVTKGETFQFNAAVEGTGEYSPAVVWTVEGKNGAHTTISAAGLLAVAADETAETLTVTAVSAADSAKYGRVTVNITPAEEPPAGPSILSVTVSPANAAVVKGETLQFSAAVEGTGAYSPAVAWTVEGRTGAHTAISAAGLLSVTADEGAATLTITAVSAANSAKYGIATVTVTKPVVSSVTVSPADASVARGATLQFSAAVEGTGAYSSAVAWTVEGKTGAHTAVSAAGLLTVAADETAATLTITAVSAANSAKYGVATVTVTNPVVSSVTVSPRNASVMKGETLQFSVAVTGTGAYSRAVLWTVEGKTGAHTAINAAGLLAVAADETAAALTVTVRSAADNTKSDSVTVTLITPLPAPTGLKVVPSIRQIYASWDPTPGAVSYEIRYAPSPGTLDSAAPFAFEPTDNSVIITDLEDGTVYDVWALAKDAQGYAGAPSAPQTCRTSDPVNPFWYSGDFDYWDSETDGYEITETTLGYNTMPPWSGDGMIGGFRYMADIRYYVEFDPEEAAALAPKTQTGKWGESLAGYPAGVFIVEYRDGYRPADSRPGDFFGVYFYGLGAPQTTSQRNSLTVNHIGDRLAYLGNSIGLSEAQGGPKGVTQQWNPETQTLEEAIERFTLENIHRFIAYVATPWYRLKGNYTNNGAADDNWIKGGDYP